jgi:hypothetical protein
MRIFILLIFTGLLFACKTETSNVAETAPQTNETLTVNQDTISEATFLAWTTNWQNHGRLFTDTSLVKYYSMPLIDLSETLNENPASARFYHGLDSLGNGAWEAKLILTGVDANGNNSGQYFDLSRPCPRHCGK